MDSQLNLNKRPCWDLIRDPFVSKPNPWTAELRYLQFTSKRVKYCKNEA